MPSINDVLKEKFNVTGSNIAETLSKIEPGSGGGSGAVEWLDVNITETHTSSSATYTMDKIAREIQEAFPYVNVFYNTDRGTSGSKLVRCSIVMVNEILDGDNPRVDIVLMPASVIYPIQQSNVTNELWFTASSGDDFPKHTLSFG